MANTTFFRKVTDKDEQITWSDVFSEFRKPHSKKDLEYALSTGLSFNTATEADMLAKWQKPWLFYPILKVGILLIILCYAVIVVPLLWNMGTVGSILMLQFIPPLVIPIVLMIFIWELNVPKNISIYELFGIFVVGTLFSFTGTAVMFPITNSIFPNISTDVTHIFYYSTAAFREEPGKLLAGVVALLFFQKKKKIYGITALTIGAAVGAGFGAFESVVYAMNQGGIANIIANQILRLVLSLGGHTLYAAPYVGALGLAMRREQKLTGRCFIDKDFLIAFALSTAMHFWWNMQDNLGYLKYSAVTVILWVELLYILKKCLNEVVVIGSKQSARVVEKSIVVMAICGTIKGAVWMSKNGETLLIGRNEGQLQFPQHTKGVSRRHCSIQLTPQGWTVRDLNSSYGTYINGKHKLAPGIDRPLQNGDVIYLANEEQAFQVMFQ